MSKRHTFGPGSLELVELRTRTRHGNIEAALFGYFDVYCGHGNMHRVSVTTEYPGRRGRSRHFAFVDYYDQPKARDAHRGDKHSAREIAESLVESQLDDWFDPCEEYAADLERSCA